MTDQKLDKANKLLHWTRLTIASEQNTKKEMVMEATPALIGIMGALPPFIFNSFIQEHPDVDNLPKYKYDELLSTFNEQAGLGYFVYYCEKKYIEKEQLPGSSDKNFSEDDLYSLWKDYFMPDGKRNGEMTIDDEATIATVISWFSDTARKEVFDKDKDYASLSHKTIEDLTQQLTQIAYWIYACCLIQEKHGK